MPNYAKIAKESRKKVLELVFKAGTSHIGSLFSCADIFAVLFERLNLDKDKLILSAGWKTAMLYYHLWRKGRLSEKDLNSYCLPGSKFIGLAEPIHPDIPFAGGSMCLGLAAGVGFALAKKIKKEEGRVFVLESDGGMNGGPTWEAMAIAAQHNLDNLVLIVDSNKLQAMGKTEEILNMEPMGKKFTAFNWTYSVLNGHDYPCLEMVLKTERYGPHAIIANTIKGKGVSIFEDNNLYHYKKLDEEEYKEAMMQLR